MQKQFVTFEIASELEELGFDEPCLAYYTTGNDVTLDKDGNLTNFVLLSAKLRGELVGHGSVKNFLFNWLKEHDKTSGELYSLSCSVTAPLWQQAIDWLMEKQNVFACPIFDQISGKGYWCTFGIMGKSCGSEWDFETYEEAREYAILKGIELCKNNL